MVFYPTITNYWIVLILKSSEDLRTEFVSYFSVTVIVIVTVIVRYAMFIL